MSMRRGAGNMLISHRTALVLAPVFAQDATTPTFQANVRLVHILATVKDQNGSPVGSLESRNFQVADNGVPQQIAVFERQTEQPLSIAVLIDASGSGDRISNQWKPTPSHRFVTPSPFRQCAGYRRTLQLQLGGRETNQPRAIPAAIDRRLRELNGVGGTSLFDAILLASRDRIQDRPGAARS